MKKQKIVVIGIVEDGAGNVLMAQRYNPEIKDAHLKWEFPGGTNEFGESLEDTVKREVFEETGLEVEVLDMLPASCSKFWNHRKYLLHSLVFCYRCRLLGGVLNSEDHRINDLKWFAKEEISDLDLLSSVEGFAGIYAKLA